jgi:hypothetical protein
VAPLGGKRQLFTRAWCWRRIARLNDPSICESDDLNSWKAEAAIAEAEDDGNDWDASTDADHRRPRPKLSEAINWTACATLWHHRIVRPSSEDRRGCGEMRLNAAATAPDREESTKSTQHAGANATTPNDEGTEAKPPDAWLRRHRNTEGERFVVATMRRANKDAWARAVEAI